MTYLEVAKVMTLGIPWPWFAIAAGVAWNVREWRRGR